MELRHYFAILWRRKWAIVVTTITTAAVAVVGTLLMTPKYKASSTLRVLTATGGSAAYGDLLYAERLMNTYAKIAKSRPVLEELATQLDLDKSPEVEVGLLATTELIEITVEDTDPVLAAEAANVLAEILIAQSKRDRGIRNDRLSVIESAQVPQFPSSPYKELNIALGLILGLAGGLGLAFLFENLDTTLYTTEQIMAVTELTVLGKIPTIRKRQQVTFLNGNSPYGEAFRRLRTNIFVPGWQAPLQAVMVTSAEPGEGKSTIVANFAFAVAQSGRKVIVVDGDLRLPSLHQIFELSNEMGLSSVLRQEATLVEAVQDSKICGVKVLTSGPPLSNPAELLGSPEMTKILEQLKQQCDLVLFDTPALLAVTDAAVLAPAVDGVILVIRRSQTRQEVVRTACEQLVAVKATPLGIVVNRAEQDNIYAYYQPRFVQEE